jgi:hypothetical protein
MRDLYKILAATLTGMTVDEFKAEAKTWLETARHPRWNRPYTELTYQPMIEVLRYLRDNAYKTYIVTGGGQDFVRVYAERVYGIPHRAIRGGGAPVRGKPERRADGAAIDWRTAGLLADACLDQTRRAAGESGIRGDLGARQAIDKQGNRVGCTRALAAAKRMYNL